MDSCHLAQDHLTSQTMDWWIWCLVLKFQDLLCNQFMLLQQLDLLWVHTIFLFISFYFLLTWFILLSFISVTPLVPYFLPESAESSESSKEICAQLKQPYENETINGDFNANTSSLTNQGMYDPFRDHPIKTSACLRGGGVKNLPNLQTDSTKKLPTVGG